MNTYELGKEQIIKYFDQNKRGLTTEKEMWEFIHAVSSRVIDDIIAHENK
jgi:hypothetical protein